MYLKRTLSVRNFCLSPREFSFPYIDLTTRWLLCAMTNARYRVVARLTQLNTLDGVAVTGKDKVKATNLTDGSGGDVQVRIANYERIVGEEPPRHYTPVFVDDEFSLK